MSEKIDRTLRNWRWWIFAPITFALSLPALTLALFAMALTGCAMVIEAAGKVIESAAEQLLVPIPKSFRNWVFKGRK